MSKIACCVCLDLFDVFGTLGTITELVCCRRQICRQCLLELPSQTGQVCLDCPKIATKEVNLDQLQQDIVRIQEIGQEQTEFYAKYVHLLDSEPVNLAYQTDTKAIKLHLELLEEMKQLLLASVPGSPLESHPPTKTVQIPLGIFIRSKDCIFGKLVDTEDNILRASTMTQRDFFESHQLPYYWAGGLAPDKTWRYLRILIYSEPGSIDMANLAGLSLEHLSIYPAELTNLATITADSRLSQTLTDLDLAFTPLEDISGLARLTNLTSLNLSKTGLTDISPLAGLKLMSLHLAINKITDITVLANMPLEVLYLWETDVSDLSALAASPRLQVLEIYNTPLVNISALTGTTLVRLDISNTWVRDITALTGMNTLQSLVAYDTLIDDIAALRNLNLIYLHLGSTGVSDITSLANQVSLAYLNLSGTKVRDFTAVINLPKLELVLDNE